MALRDFEGLERRRLRAVRLFEGGETQSSVARRLRVSRTTAMRWARAWETEGRDGLRAAGRAGRKPRLSSDQVDRIEQALLEGPLAFGYATELWTLGRGDPAAHGGSLPPRPRLAGDAPAGLVAPEADHAREGAR